MADELIFFGVIAALGMLGVEVGHAFGAVFGEAKGLAREEEMEERETEPIEPGPRRVPAMVEVHGGRVGDVAEGVEGEHHGKVGHAGWASGVESMDELIEQFVDLGLARGALHGDLVGDTTAENTAAVIGLGD